ncbi:MAG: NAD(P)/FAD-dependent oxidoreductase [Acidimicrobiia bacterium]
MTDFDVVVVGGGINGLTTAAYLAHAGLSVGVFEARGQCGAHCDTVELGLPGYLHNPHAVWLVPAMSPAMADLDLARHGLELRGTDVLFAKTFPGGTSVVQALDPAVTDASLRAASEHDADVAASVGAYLGEHLDETLHLTRRGLYGPPSAALLDRTAAFNGALLERLGLPVSGDDLLRMTGLELLGMLFESEEARTTPAALGEFTGQWPSHRRLGPLALSLAGFQLMACHTARGGSHALTHALVRCVLANGGEIHSTSPVERILTDSSGRALGVRLGPHATDPGAEVTARVVVSNLTLAPTFLDLLGEEVIGPERARRVKAFNYDDPQLLAVMYALDGDPQFAAARRDPAVQRSWVGYYGGETLDVMRGGFSDLAAGIMPDDPMGGWFLPTRADPTQAPPGCHTAYVWASVPPCPRRWRGGGLAGWDAWHDPADLAEPLADAMTERMEAEAPGFSDLVVERHVMTPRHQEMNNPSAIRGNMIGGSAIPEQFGENRPLPGILNGGASRSFVPGLYLSNSIHPYGATHLASGYLTACEVAEDLGCRDVEWWRAEPLDWFLANLASIPLNLGVTVDAPAGAGS